MVLPKDGTGMHVKDITEEIFSREIRKQGKAKTPVATLRIILINTAKNNDSKIIDKGKGIFSLKV